MIKAVVFDVGGVLCDWVTVVKTMAASIGADYQEFYDAFLLYSFDPKTGSDLGLIGMDEFFAKLADHFSRPEKAKVWRQEFVPGFKRIEPTFELVKELKGKYKLALLTNAKIGLWDEWQEGNLPQYFPVIVDSAEVQVLKPDEKIFRILLDRLKLPVAERLFIDDFPEYTAAAAKLGFPTVTFTDPEESVKLIRKTLYGSI